MSLIVQISDPHFGTETAPVADALVQLHHRLRPDLTIVSGDITQRATRRQFDAAQRYLERLQPRASLVIPGNHDIPLFNLWVRLRSPYSRYRSAFGADLKPVFDSADALVIGVNTTVPHWHKDGAISDERIAEVAERLAAARCEQLRIVVTHQPAAVLDSGDRRDQLVGGEAAIRAWMRAGVDIVMGGHIHTASVFPLRSREHGDHQAWFVQAGTAISSRVRDGRPNSVNVICADRSDDSPARIERWDFDAASGGFRCAMTTTLPRQRIPG